MSPAELAIAPAGGDTAMPLNLAKQLRLLERVAGPLAGRAFFDCGCGAGEYVAALAARGARAVGVELQREKLRAAAPGPRARLCTGDAQRLPFPDGAFELALLNEVLEHVPDEAAALAELHRVLAPGGRLVLLSPSRLYPFETHGVSAHSGRRLPHTLPFVPWIPLALGRRVFLYWARNYWPWELRARVRAAGFAVERGGYLWQTFENISGHQPAWQRRAAPWLRALAELLERTPGLRAFGVSQLVVARRA